MYGGMLELMKNCLFKKTYKSLIPSSDHTKDMKSELIAKVDNLQSVSGIKLVKKATVFQKDGVYFAKHYDTIIFAHDTNTGRTEIDKNCSMTSNRQIRYCLDFFNIDEETTIDIHEGSKWNHSGGFY